MVDTVVAAADVAVVDVDVAAADIAAAGVGAVAAVGCVVAAVAVVVAVGTGVRIFLDWVAGCQEGGVSGEDAGKVQPDNCRPCLQT